MLQALAVRGRMQQDQMQQDQMQQQDQMRRNQMLRIPQEAPENNTYLTVSRAVSRKPYGAILPVLVRLW